MTRAAFSGLRHSESDVYFVIIVAITLRVMMPRAAFCGLRHSESDVYFVKSNVMGP